MSRFSLRGAAQWILSIAGALCVVEGLVEGGLVQQSGASIDTAVLCALFSGALAFVLIALASPLLLLIAMVAARLGVRRGLGLVLLAFGSAPLALAIADPFGRSSALPYVAIAIAAQLALACAGYLAYATPRRNGCVAAALLATASLALDVGVGAEAYPEVHGLALLVLIAALGSLLSYQLTTEQTRLAPLAALGALSVALLVWIHERAPELYAVSVLHGRNVARTTAWLRGPFDRDGDGFAPLLWGGDCNDLDERVYPGAPDPPGAGDQNCNGLDALERAPADLFSSTPMAAPRLQPGRIDRVVLLTLDTFRPELLRSDVMPNLVRLAQHGARFARSYASATATVASLPLLHKPALHAPSVVDALTQAGIASQVFAPSSSALRNRAASHQDDELAPLVLKTLMQQEEGRPSFVWAHFMGLHADYVLWPDASNPPAVAPFSPAYVSEAMHLDLLLGPLLAWLEASRERSVIIVTGDHGEGWGEHGAYSHTRLGWEEMVRTPLVLLAPGLSPGEYPHIASHRDIPATVVGAFGLDPEAAGAERFGRSMLRWIGHEHIPLRLAAVSHSSRQASGALGHGPLGILIEERMKVIVGITDGVVELYDLVEDPGERHDLARSRPAETKRLVQRLSLHIDAEQWPAAANQARRAPGDG